VHTEKGQVVKKVVVEWVVLRSRI